MLSYEVVIIYLLVSKQGEVMPHFSEQQSVREQPPVLMVEESLLTMIQAEMRFTSQSLNKSRVCCNRQ